MYSPARKITILAVVFLLCFTVPYFFPVAASVSLSYVAQFNNRICAILFILGVVVFSFLTGGELGRRDDPSESERLSFLSLGLSIAFVVFMLWVQLFEGFPHRMGLESNYNLNRLEMLVGGLRPYRDFEYIYGPLLIYAPYLLARILHCTAVTAYYIWWSLEWLIGTWMYWFTVRNLPLRLRPIWRDVLFWGLFVIRFAFDFSSEGTAYTPLRTVSAAFWITLVYVVWSRRQNALHVILTGVAALIVNLGVSADQAMGLGAALLCWFGLLSYQDKRRFPRLALASFAAAAVVSVSIGMFEGLFYTTGQLSHGAFTFPLLPSIPSSLLLIPYFGAGCAVAHELRHRCYTSSSFPLLIGGLAMLPAALGRCDMGHLLVAFPAFLLGTAYLLQHGSVRLLWGGAVLASTALPISAQVIVRTAELFHLARNSHAVAKQLGVSASSTGSLPAQRGFEVVAPVRSDNAPQSAIRLTEPCPVTYRTPNVQPRPFETAAQACLDTGYYLTWVDAFTVEAIERKVRELDRTPRKPVLLYDAPMTQQFVTSDSSMTMLLGLEAALVLPRERRTMPDYSIITDYIQKNYTPDAQGENGMRVWRPKQIN